MTAPVEAPRTRTTIAVDPVPRSMREEVLDGLRGAPKRLSPKYFYDSAGARLFEQITTLDSYYPTRTELAILRNAAGEIAQRAGPRVALIEYGSGAGTKVRLLLDALDEPIAYIPIDIAGEQLRQVALALRDDYPEVAIHPVRADYTRALDLPKMDGESRHVAFFPGSTIGNFEPSAAASFLRAVRDTVGDDGAMILGVDRVKDAGTLEAAYNDPEGITAQFNLNLLARLNRELDATFKLD
ncbi:MAG: L-histidine N(alpha)-methyltransferase, partial [Gemmatimonadales bacterium]